MASWVAPIVAADLWGCSVEHIMAEVAKGTIPARTLGHFLFVGIGFAASEQAAATPEPADVVSPEEIIALQEVTAEPADEPTIEPVTTSEELTDWRDEREQTGLRRRTAA